MLTQEHQLLWSRIQGFSLDDRTAQVTFSDKLATSQNWTIAFAQRTIEEYRKFIFLCCISPKGAAPSKIVDEVWHLHLTYTQSYWIDLCKNTLGRDIHHYPSRGGEEEDARHQQWYAETLQLYRSVFGVNVPSDIWPTPNQEVLIQKGTSLKLSVPAKVAMIGLLLLPFVFISTMYHTWSPFALGGPHFLAFFPVYATSLILIYVIYRMEVIKEEMALAAACYPDDVSVFQVANFLYGSHRALQTGIVDLVRKGLLEIPGYNQFVIKKPVYGVNPRDTNPLLSGYNKEEEGGTLNYDTLMTTWYNNENFSHPTLDALKGFKSRSVPFLRNEVFYVAMIGMVVARCIQGVVNNRPVILLFLEGVVFVILFALLTKRFSPSATVCRKVKELYRQRWQSLINPDDQLVAGFAVEGTPAISHLTEGAVLSGLFLAHTSVWWRSGNGVSSSGDSSSCSAGSSCSGGSSCGGGSGCGGCSGS